VISNYRMLLAGPNPLCKLGGILAQNNQPFEMLAYFQALGTALEGIYTLSEANAIPPQKRRPPLQKSRGQGK